MKKHLAWNRDLRKFAAGLFILFLAGVLGVNLYMGIYAGRVKRECAMFMANLFGNLHASYPHVREEELVSILTDRGNQALGEHILAGYGIFTEYGNGSYLQQERQIGMLMIGVNAAVVLLFVLVSCFLLSYLRRRQQRIEGLETYMFTLLRKEYDLDLDDNYDDELSGLRNELYKLAVFLKEQAENAREKKRSLADSVANISHQLKTPLTSVIVLMDNLSDDFDMDDVTRRHFMSEITYQLTGMSWMVSTMLKLSRLDAGVVELERERINLRELLGEVLRRVETTAEWNDISFSLDLPEEIAVCADRRWTTEALANIVKNAIEHSSVGGSVDIRGEENDVYVQITVQDHGEGITEEERERLFDRFYRGASAREDGVGIGLALAKEVIERQNGYVSVESEKGRGSCFAIKFMHL